MGDVSRSRNVETLRQMLDGKRTFTCALAKSNGCGVVDANVKRFRIGHVSGKEFILCVKHAQDLFHCRGFRSVPLDRAIDNQIAKVEKGREESSKLFDALTGAVADAAPSQ